MMMEILTVVIFLYYQVNNLVNSIIHLIQNSLLLGDYQVSIKVNDRHIKGSPFKVKVIGDSDPRLERIKKIETSGKGIAIGKSFQFNEFWIDGRKAGLKAELTINIKNPERASTQLKVIRNFIEFDNVNLTLSNQQNLKFVLIFKICSR